MQDLLQFVKNFRAITQRFGKIRCAFRHDHELLEIDRGIGMRAAVQNIHHRHWQNARTGSAQITKERKVCRRRSRVRGCKRHTEQRVCAQIFFVGRTIQLDQLGIDFFLRAGVKSPEGIGNSPVHIPDRFEDAFAAITLLIAIPQFPCFMLTRAGTTRHGCSSERATFQSHIDFNGGIAARI